MKDKVIEQLKRWSSSATNMTKVGSKEVREYTRGYERGINDAKEAVALILSQIK